MSSFVVSKYTHTHTFEFELRLLLKNQLHSAVVWLFKKIQQAYQNLEQSTEEKYKELAQYLGSEIFINHEHDDVQLLVACCIADIFRVFAPDSPYDNPDDLKVRLWNRKSTLSFFYLIFFMMQRKSSFSYAISSKVSKTYRMVRSIVIFIYLK